MAAGWVKSLQCKSRAYDDVYHQPKQHQNLLLTSTSCRNSYQNLKDVVDKPKPKSKPKPPKPDPFSSKSDIRRSVSSVKPKPKSKSKTEPSSPSNRVRRTVSAPISKGMMMDPGSGPVGMTGPFFPSVAELQEGHPSRNVVEIIFHSRWGPKGFAGRVEMVFKVQNAARSTARFEEYRDSIMLRAGPGSGGRCVADGNEMMRFHCLGPTSAASGCDGAYKLDSGKGAASAVCTTYSGSGMAHESAGGGKGRRAMVVCRVIAGRVSKLVGPVGPVLDKKGELEEFDSVSGENGELLVFDSRAVLPCFLVIYKL